MPVDYKDYYKTLNVSKDASKEDLKKAFRKLARQYHPDHAKDGDKEESEAKFKEINEAYEVLSDPEKRQKYDTLGANWDQAQQGGGSWDGANFYGFGGQPRSRGQSYHFSGTGFSDFFEQFFGMGGGGFDPFGQSHRQGAGFPSKGQDIEAEIMISLREVAQGSTRQIAVTKTDPQSGQEVVHKYNVRIPPGIRDGQRIRVASQGHASQGSGESGDLFLKARFASDPDFRVKGGNLYYDLKLDPWDAATGTKATVRTLEKAVRLNIPAGTSSGQRLRLKGKGLPSTKGTPGDLIVEVQVQTPSILNEKQKDAWNKLKDAYS